jgi:hypothetical protein
VILVLIFTRYLKGTVSQDFQPLVFFIKQSHLDPDHAVKYFRILL